MRIAIVAPSSVPFCIGGAEKLWWGLQRAINTFTPHQAELIKLPSPERDFWEIIDSYRRFSELDLSMFDCVISTKYPAWMVSHPNHICYLLHRLRGLYDTCDLASTCANATPRSRREAGLEDGVYGVLQDSRVAALLSLMQTQAGNREALPDVWAMLSDLRDREMLDPAYTAFPGPLIRDLVHFLDDVALTPRTITKFAAISHNVAARRHYFPEGADVQILHPPSDLEAFRCDGFDYFFTASRLDGPKRVDLIVEAMKRVRTDIPLRIAGTGPQLDRLRSLAGDDPRITFLGFVPDRDMIDLYANALAVPFVPYDEDYGLITYEAMMSAKPVLTTVDSGGPTEFVRDGETGYCTAPDPAALAQRMQELADNPAQACAMGRRARAAVQGITWKATVEALLDTSNQGTGPAILRHERRKITVALTYPVYPPRGGGQLRNYHIYRHLARWFGVDLVTFTGSEFSPFRREIAPSLYEIRIPKSQEHQAKEWEIEAKLGHVCTDVAMLELYHYTPDYLDALHASASHADAVVAGHPYLYYALRACTESPLWYEAHNVEYCLKAGPLCESATGQRLLGTLKMVEGLCCTESELVLACAQEDCDVLCKLYGVGRERIQIVPNGVDTSGIRFRSGRTRSGIRERFGINRQILALFIGSWHDPNIECMPRIADLAQKMPEVGFLVLGSVCQSCRSKDFPANVGLLGEVDDTQKQVALDIASVAINPITSGSGTNLKMLEYMAAGLPVVSTPFGARGLGLGDGRYTTIAELDCFMDAIQGLAARSAEDIEAQRCAARRYVEEVFDWQVIVTNFVESIETRNCL
jgi:glycosyltransferase involved in cell wall biosynthesis